MCISIRLCLCVVVRVCVCVSLQLPLEWLTGSCAGAGEFIGGCDETRALDSRGGLLPKLKAAGVSYEA